jgi:hypothetical protein
VTWSNRRGFPVDPLSATRPENSEKRALLADYARRYPLPTFVETGIYRGDCAALDINALFEIVFVIDPSVDNCMRVLEALPPVNVVRVLPGDSAELLPELLRSLTRPALFWLDAHGMEANEPSSPLLMELGAILCWRHADRSVVLMDDMRLMGIVPGWPSLDALADLCEPKWNVEVALDVMRCTPKS